MKPRDLIKLSCQNIRTQPKRHIMIMLAVGMIFGVIFVANFYLQGIENTYQNLANYATDEKVLLIATPSLNNNSLTPEITITDDELIADVEQFGGKVAGKIQRYGGEYGNIILDASYLQPNIIVQYNNLPTNIAPILADSTTGQRLLQQDFPTNSISISKHLEYYQRFCKSLIGHTFTDSNGMNYLVVGLAPSNYHLFQLPLFDIFGELTGSFPAPTAQSIVINSPNSGQQAVTTNASLIVFENPQQAYQYLLYGHGNFIMTDFPDRTYQVDTIAGMSPETMYIFHIKHLVLNVFSTILFVIAIIIIIFTSIRLTDQDQSNIQLYSNLGATTRQVRMIYWAYFLMLIISGLLLAFMIASAFTIIYSLIKQDLLSSIFQLGFSLSNAPNVILWGMNWEVCGFIVATIASSLLCILINYHKLQRQ